VIRLRFGGARIANQNARSKMGQVVDGCFVKPDDNEDEVG